MVSVTTSELNYKFHSEHAPVAVGYFTVFRHSFLKDIRIQMRYKQNFVAQFIRTLVFILIFWMFALSFAFEDLPANDTGTVFLFFLSAISLMMYDGVALWSPYNTVRRDLYNGTLEAIYQTPGSRYAYYLGGTAAAALYNSVFVVPLFITLVLVASPSVTTVISLAVTILVALSTLMMMGILVGLTAILWKNMSALLGILSMLFQFVTGTIVPFASLPIWAQYVGYIFPITWGLDLMRFYIFGAAWQTIYALPVMWLILVGQLLFFAITSVVLLAKVERFGKKQGLHLL